MLGDGMSQAKRPRIADEDDWAEGLLDDGGFVTQEPPPCLKCCQIARQQRRGGHDTVGGYLAAGALNRLLSVAEPIFPGHGPTKRVLGVQVASTSGLAQQLVALFHLARRMVDILLAPDSCKDWIKVNSSSGDLTALRNQASEFLTLVSSSVDRVLKGVDASTSLPATAPGMLATVHQQLRAMYDHLRHHLNPVFAGTVETLSLSVEQQDSALILVFHIWLDVAWNHLAVLVLMAKARISGDHLGQSPDQLLVQHCQVFAMDLLRLQCTAMGKSWPDVQAADLLPCLCVREAWQTLQVILDWSSEQFNTLSFWSFINSILTEFLSTSSSDPEPARPKSIPEWLQSCSPGQRRVYCWSLLGFFNQLYQYDQFGCMLQRHGHTYSNWLFVQDLLRLYIDKDATSISGDDRMHMRCLLTSLIPLADFWPPSQDALLLLWDCMHRFLNFGSSRDADHSGPSINTWVQDCVRLCNAPADVQPSSSQQLWWLFLRVLAIELKKSRPGVNMWLLVKGRFLSRFNRRRMQELTWHGLENFCSLFFILALCTDTADIVSKMAPLLETVQQTGVSRQLVCWRGLLSTHVLCEMQHVPTTQLLKSLSNWYSLLLRTCLSSGSAENFTVLSSCLDYLEDAHNNGHLRSTLHHFITPEWTAMFNAALRRERECCRLLECSAWLVEVVRSEVLLSSEEGSERHSASITGVSNKIWQVVHPAVGSLATQHHLSSHLSQQVSDVCMVLAQLAYSMPSSAGDSPSFHGIVQQFGAAEKVPVSIRLGFLSHLISDSDTCQLLLSKDTSNNTPSSPLAMLFHCWMTAIVSCSSSTNADPRTQHQLMDFTRAMQELPDIQEVFQFAEPAGTPDPVDAMSLTLPEASILTFIRRLGLAYRAAAPGKQFSYRSQAASYFSHIMPLAEGHLAAEKATPALRCIYRIVGCVVQWCSVMLYSRTSHRCLLPQLLDKLVVPLSTTKKPVPTAIDSCIRRQVYQFFFGVACLDFGRDDYVRRKLREIVHRNLLQPSQSLSTYGGITVAHPYLAVLLSLKKMIGDSDARAVRQLMLSAVRDFFLVLPTKHANLMQAAVQLLSCLHQISSSEAILNDCPVLLPRLLMCLLACELGRVGNDSRTLMPILESCVKNILVKAEASNQADRQPVVQLVLGYAAEHIRQHKHSVFRPLVTLSPSCPKLMSEFAPFAEGLVQKFETDQGKGNDLQLRSMLEQVSKASQPAAYRKQ